MNDDIHALASAYLLDALDPEERDAFEAHLERCETCRHDLEELRPVLDALAEATATPPPPALRDRVLASIDDVRPLPPIVDPARLGAPPEAASAHHRSAHGRRRTTAPGAWVLGAAAVLLLVVAVAAAFLAARSTDGPGGSPSVDAVLEAPDARTIERSFDGFRAEVVLSRSENRAVVRSSDLPDAPAGRTYQLWYQRPGEGLVPAGLLPADGDGHQAVLAGPLDDAVAIGVTVEPSGGSPAPTTEPVAFVELT